MGEHKTNELVSAQANLKVKDEKAAQQESKFVAATTNVTLLEAEVKNLTLELMRSKSAQRIAEEDVRRMEAEVEASQQESCPLVCDHDSNATNSEWGLAAQKLMTGVEGAWEVLWTGRLSAMQFAIVGALAVLSLLCCCQCLLA